MQFRYYDGIIFYSHFNFHAHEMLQLLYFCEEIYRNWCREWDKSVRWLNKKRASVSSGLQSSINSFILINRQKPLIAFFLLKHSSQKSHTLYTLSLWWHLKNWHLQPASSSNLNEFSVLTVRFWYLNNAHVCINLIALNKRTHMI